LVQERNTAIAELTQKNHTTIIKPIVPCGEIEGVLDSQEWRRFKIIYKERVANNIKLYTLELKDPYGYLGIGLGDSVNIRTIISNTELIGDYSPCNAILAKGYFQLLIKIYSGDIFTNFLDTLRDGDFLEVIKKEGKFKLNDMYKEIGMIAGGTGIAPMMQILHTLLPLENDLKFYLIIINSTEADAPFRRIISDFKECYPERFIVHWLITKAETTWKNASTGSLSKELLKKFQNEKGDNKD